MRDEDDAECAFNKISDLTVDDRVENESSGFIFFKRKLVLNTEA